MKAEKVALVTGASSGIGERIALRLLADGFIVYGAARRLDKMAGLRAAGVSAVQMDVTEADDIERVVSMITREHGGVDVLVNNAGFATYGAVEDTSIDDARYQFEVNLFAVAELTRAVLPHMRAKKSGYIINISSMGGKIYTPLGAWYHATKHALEGWSDCLRLELRGFGIKVVIIEPGLIETEFGDVLLGPLIERSGDTAYADLATSTASNTARAYAPGRGSSPDVVARAVSQALKARRPRTRYVVGRFARPAMFIRKWLGDRAFDRLLLRRM